jgi:hypothetical protein
MSTPHANEIAHTVEHARARIANKIPSPLCETHDAVVVHLHDQLEDLKRFVDCRAEVLAFAIAMEGRLRKKDQDRVASWKHKAPRAISVDLVSKAMALDVQILRATFPNPSLLAKHAIDIGNFAMFITDVAGVLDIRALAQDGLIDVAPEAVRISFPAAMHTPFDPIEGVKA